MSNEQSHSYGVFKPSKNDTTPVKPFKKILPVDFQKRIFQREREGERERERERDRERQRDRDRETERQRQRQRETERKRETEKEREREGAALIICDF